MRTFIRSLSYFRADLGRVVATLGLLVLGVALGLLKPWPLAWLVDSFIGHQTLPPPLDRWLGDTGSPRQLSCLVGLLVGIHWTHAVVTALQSGSIILIGLRGLARVRRSIYSALLRLSLKSQQERDTGDLIYRATWDACAFQTLLQHGVFTTLAAGAGVAAMTVVMARLNGRLTLAALITVPVLMWGIRVFSARMGQLGGEAQSADAGIATSVQQVLAALPLIQSFTRESNESERFRSRAETALAARWRQHRTEVAYLAMVACVLAAGTAAITWVGAREVSAGRLPVGHLLVFLAYLGQLYEPLNQLSNVGATLSVAGAGTRRVLELLDAGQPGVPEGSATPPREGSRCSLEFDQVVAGYTPGRPVLKRLKLSVRGGDTVAIIGPSGAGKSTLLSLLLRFVEPDAGRITLDGHDLREFSLKSLRHSVAWVPQEPVLLPGTLAENIAFGAGNPSRNEIEAAARAANAHDFIERLPQGYDTVVGDGAARLSAGEKQRLSLARAFIKQAPILLLDEPTSALDGESERLILQSLRSWGRDRTVLMVAHRLQTLDIADRIVVLRDGEVLEAGTPAELVAKGGYFATLSGNN